MAKEYIQGIGKIGKTGTKVHPCLLEKDELGTLRLIAFTCHCPGTNTGMAASKAQIWEGNRDSVTCRKP